MSRRDDWLTGKQKDNVPGRFIKTVTNLTRKLILQKTSHRDDCSIKNNT